MKALLIALFFSGMSMAGNVKLVNDTMFTVRFKFVVGAFEKIIPVPAFNFREVALAAELTHEPPKNLVTITGNTNSLIPDVCCSPEFSVGDFLNRNFTTTFSGSDFRFSHCTVIEGI
jgi:hypothetical protein